MPTHRERILQFIASFPGRDDDQIAAALKIEPRQTVNMICRKLSEEALIARQRGASGKLVNAPRQPSGGVVPLPKQAGPTCSPAAVGVGPITEDQVKSSLLIKLTDEGWSAEVAWGKARGIDIDARRGNERWLIECKGTGSLAPMQNNYFLGVIGEIAQRMSDPSAKHSIALPDLPKFRRLWSELPLHFKASLSLTALFVGPDGTVTEFTE